MWSLYTTHKMQYNLVKNAYKPQTFSGHAKVQNPLVQGETWSWNLYYYFILLSPCGKIVEEPN